MALDAGDAGGVGEDRSAAGGVAGILHREVGEGVGVDRIGRELEQLALALAGDGDREHPPAARVADLGEDDVFARPQLRRDGRLVRRPAALTQVLVHLLSVEVERHPVVAADAQLDRPLDVRLDLRVGVSLGMTVAAEVDDTVGPAGADGAPADLAAVGRLHGAARLECRVGQREGIPLLRRRAFMNGCSPPTSANLVGLQPGAAGLISACRYPLLRPQYLARSF